MKTMKLMATTALGVLTGLSPAFAQMTEIGAGEGALNIVAWAGYIERGEIRPMVAKTYPLNEIATAQEDFLSKKYTGKLVLLPPA